MNQLNPEQGDPDPPAPPQGAPEHGSIFLIGMMGAGKSTVGRMLATSLGLAYLDADRELEARSGVSIPTIFEIEGEAAFRRREAALLDELTKLQGIVLATGGGSVLEAETRERLRARGLVVYLKASADEIFRRTRRDRARPLLQAADPHARIVELIGQREPLYEEIAHLRVQSGASSPRRLVDRLLEEPRVRELALRPAG